MNEADVNVIGGNANTGEEEYSSTSIRDFIPNTSTGKHDTHYNMNDGSRGLAIIFNSDDNEMMSLDCKTLVACLEQLDFQVHIFYNLNSTDIQTKIDSTATRNHSEYNCILIAVLTHNRKALYAENSKYKPDILWAPFAGDKCLTLAGKPKIFIVCTYQDEDGKTEDSSVKTPKSRTQTDGHFSEDTYKIPTQADFLIIFSTVPSTEGSLFIKALCTELSEHGHDHDLLTLLTLVNCRMDVYYENSTPRKPVMYLQKQIPCITTTMTRLVKFNSKK